MWFTIYLLFFKNTPEDYRIYSFFFPRVRSYLVKNYLKKCGASPRVKKGAEISPNSSLGDYSELGTRCMIQSNVSIGSHVIMGPDIEPHTAVENKKRMTKKNS